MKIKANLRRVGAVREDIAYLHFTGTFQIKHMTSRESRTHNEFHPKKTRKNNTTCSDE
jgi:hypothetical protein